MKRPRAALPETRTPAAAPPAHTMEQPKTETEATAEEASRRWYDPRWWQWAVSAGVLLALLLLVTGFVVRPDVGHWVRNRFHPEVAVPRVTPSPAPRQLPHVTTSLPVVQATPNETAAAQPTPTTPVAPPPPVPTATAVPGPATITITIACTASKTNPGFCEFLDGTTITQGSATCSLTLGVWSYVGQQTEAVGCAEPHGSDVSFVGAPVPCSTNDKGACAGDVAQQK